MRTGDGSARRITDVWSEQEWHDSRIDRELYRQLGVEHQMSIGLPGTGPVFVGIALNRARVAVAGELPRIARLDAVPTCLRNSDVHNTGIVKPEYGEGV